MAVGEGVATTRLRQLLVVDPKAAAHEARSLGRSARQLFGAAGWAVSMKDLGVECADVRAILIPRLSGGFHAVVNAARRPRSDEVEWLLAHEYAHTLFFAAGAPPRRTLRHTPREETLCDAFADEFTQTAGSLDRAA